MRPLSVGGHRFRATPIHDQCQAPLPCGNRSAEIFAAHPQGGEVTFGYETIVWYGRLRTGT